MSADSALKRVLCYGSRSGKNLRNSRTGFITAKKPNHLLIMPVFKKKKKKPSLKSTSWGRSERWAGGYTVDTPASTATAPERHRTRRPEQLLCDKRETAQGRGCVSPPEPRSPTNERYCSCPLHWAGGRSVVCPRRPLSELAPAARARVRAGANGARPLHLGTDLAGRLGERAILSNNKHGGQTE